MKSPCLNHHWLLNHQIIKSSNSQCFKHAPAAVGLELVPASRKFPPIDIHDSRWLQVGWASRDFNGPIFQVFPWFGDVYLPGAIVTCFMNGSEWSLFSEISMDPLISLNSPKLSLHLSSRLGSDGWQDSALHAHHLSNTLFSYPLVI